MPDGRGARSTGSVPDEVSAVLAELGERGVLSAQTQPRVADLLRRFAVFAETGLGRSCLAAVTAEDARLFVQADSAAGPPSVATMHLRRSVLRLLFRTVRGLQLAEGDPTVDLDLPRRTSLRTRPLSDEEVALGRSAALHTLTGTRLAAAWALAEATARTAEIPALTVADLDLEGKRVWIHGSGRTAPRWGSLSSWGATQIERHLRTLRDAEPVQLLVYRGSGSAQSRQATACMAIADVLSRAGLAAEPDVRPLSVAAWAGRQILHETGRIDEVARRLGMRSLDRSAQLIGFDWQHC